MTLRVVFRRIVAVLLWLVVIMCLAATIVPQFLDRIYYRGATSGHFDGARFFNSDGSDDDTRPVPGGGGRAGFFWRQATGRDGRPAWPDAVPVRPARAAELGPLAAGGMRATWIGHASVLVQTPKLNILTDPVWSDTAGPFGFGPRRVAAPGVRFEDLPKIDLVLVSHNHYDHMDLATLKRLWDRDRPVFITSLGNDALLRSAGIPARNVYDCGQCPGVAALDWGQNTIVEGAQMRGWQARPIGAAPFTRVSVVRTHHWGSRWLSDRNRALWSGFVVDVPGSGSIFFAGDTGLGDGRWIDEAKAAAIQPIRLALIPIGAFRFVPRQMQSAAHIGPIDAVEVFRRLGASTAIPIHWGTFRLSYEGYRTPPTLLAAAARCAGVPAGRFAPVRIGRPVAIRSLGGGAVSRVDRAAVVRCLDTPAVEAMR
ncbi:MBL fold metallo-hydrolase [Sphingomonas endolithica]|uniref:MBL fold metallo-hydrolase n=1 Tax=Sphingomonas endolithica TaxID=2972485 RepID=UPI0021AEA824|nr:MBL fold metallo-hydrolase [Sphingomonas sp. ZFBP2030]